MKLPRELGFTLIELLIAITIIALLATIGVVTFGNVPKESRDSRRKSDIDTIATVLESNYATSQTPYPPLTGALFVSGFIPTPPPGTVDSLGAVETNYLLISVSGDSDSWVSTQAGGNRYKVCAHLERARGNASDEDGTFITANNGQYYCRANQQ